MLEGYRPWVCAASQLNREIDKGDEDRADYWISRAEALARKIDEARP